MKKVIVVVLIMVFSLGTKAQDIHFSQFYASPLNLNPAMTGFTPSQFRIAANYRNQWAQVSVPFVTSSASFDINFLRKKNKLNYFGAGLLFVNDKSGSGQLSNQSVFASFAYHQRLQKNRNNFLSVGLQAGVVQKSLNINKLVFGAQFDLLTKSFSNPSIEHFNASGAIVYPALYAGILYSSIVSKFASYYAGVTMFNANVPKESFLLVQTNNDGTVNRLNRRINGHVGAKLGLTESVYLNPTLLYQMQSKDGELVIGTALTFQLSDLKMYPPTSLFIGSYYRLGDAAIAMAGFETKGLRLGLSYDINLSDLKVASAKQGGFELSLIYEAAPKASPRKIIYCPRF